MPTNLEYKRKLCLNVGFTVLMRIEHAQSTSKFGFSVLNLDNVYQLCLKH